MGSVLSELPPKQRQAIELRYIEEMTQHEAASVQRISVRNHCYLIQKARRRLAASGKTPLPLRRGRRRSAEQPTGIDFNAI